MPPGSGSAKRRQPLLLTTRSPLSERLGDAFFRSLPTGPGVYFFRDADGRLLYIGQSGSLRHRVSSYRHVDPDRHPRRLLRLIHRVASIDWRDCATAAEAIALEAALLLEHRPPFNRAGVWPSAEWWLEVRLESGNRLHLRMSRAGPPALSEELSDGRTIAIQPGLAVPSALFPPENVSDFSNSTCQWLGPLTSRHRHTFPALARCLFLAMHPQADSWAVPVGLMRNSGCLAHSWMLPEGGVEVLGAFIAFLQRPGSAFFAFLTETLDAAPARQSTQAMRDFWTTQLEEIEGLLPKQLPPSAAGEIKKPSPVKKQTRILATGGDALEPPLPPAG